MLPFLAIYFPAMQTLLLAVSHTDSLGMHREDLFSQQVFTVSPSFNMDDNSVWYPKAICEANGKEVEADLSLGVCWCRGKNERKVEFEDIISVKCPNGFS